MMFNTLGFLIFFPIVIAIYFIIPKKVRVYWLLIASYYFYMSWNVGYGTLLFASTFTTYLGGLIISKVRNKPGKVTALIVTLLCNFGMLFVFKYFGFFTDVVIHISESFGVTLKAPEFSLLLPMGISFFTFQAVSYTIDVYRDESVCEKHFFKYALFVSFFPQLVAGPIERSGNLLKQIKDCANIKLWNARRVYEGAILMLYGYILKMIISDRAKLFVDKVYDLDGYAAYTGLIPIIATILFAIQIYCDFAGYTYIAMGAAKVMGFQLMDNFNTPYFATSITDFWARWHISLTNWFRDYVYIPLGGNRKGKLRKYINIFVVFTLSGLWHGASYTFVFWGVLHGILRIVDEASAKVRDKVFKFFGARENFSYRLFRVMGTFIFVCLAWVFFRARHMDQALDIIRNMWHWNPWVLHDGTIFNFGLDAKEWNVMFAALAFLTIMDCFKYKKKDLLPKVAEQGWIFKGLVLVVGILAVVIFGIYGPQYDAASFIYFQF